MSGENLSASGHYRQPDDVARLGQRLGYSSNSRQAADDAVGADGGIGGQADPVAIVPDCVNAEALRGDDFPFEVVADHPGVVRADSERFHRMIVGPLLGLAETVLALDLANRTTFARCDSAAPLVISANLTPSSFSRSRVSCASGNIDNSSTCKAL